MSLEVKNRTITEGSLVDLLDSSTQGSEGYLKLRSAKNPSPALPYYTIKEESTRLASQLQSQGVGPGERVVLWGANSPQWVTSYFAILKSGAIVVPFDVRATTNFLGKVAEATQPRLIIAGTPQIDDLPLSYGIPVLEMNRANITQSNQNQPEISVLPQNPAEIVFTSGTTGNPKGAVLTHRNILTNIQAIQEVIKIKPEYKLLSILPLSHMFEMTAGLLVPLAERASVIYTDTLTPNNLLKSMQEERITCMAVVPQVLQLFQKGIEQEVIKKGKKREWDLLNQVSQFIPMGMRRILFSSLHKRMGGQLDFFVCGGAALDSALAASWENLGIKVIQGYGMTEASPVVTCDTMSDRNHQYVGRPLPGVSVKIAYDKEILVKGPNVMSGYWNNPSATAAVLEDGWYHTGDLGSLDQGRLKLHGRKKDMIVLPDGSNVYPEDVEWVLKQQGIPDAVVFNKENGQRGEIHAVLLLEKGKDPKALIHQANGHLAPHQKVRSWSIWPELDFPRTPTLKVKRFEIIEKLKNY